ncbi:hypothetical protein BST61_g9204 [Cercospora zeina]
MLSATRQMNTMNDEIFTCGSAQKMFIQFVETTWENLVVLNHWRPKVRGGIVASNKVTKGNSLAQFQQNIHKLIQPWPIPFKKRNAPPTEYFSPLLMTDGARFLEEVEMLDDPGRANEKAGRNKDDLRVGTEGPGRQVGEALGNSRT